MSIGDYVKEGQDIVNLESIDPLKVDFRVPEIYLRQVQAGQTLQVTLDAMPGQEYEGKVLAINPLRRRRRPLDRDPRAGEQRRTRRCGPACSRACGSSRRQRGCAGVPEEALVPQGDEQYVFRVVDGKATRPKVEIGQRRDGKVEIRQGVAPATSSSPPAS